MIKIIRTDSHNPGFITLVKELDADLAIRDGDEHPFYAQFNKIDKIKYVVVAYDDDQPIGCGAIKEYAPNTMEVKRMYSSSGGRRKGVATKVLTELETWAAELSYDKCILETGIKQPEAIALYKKNGYQSIPNYGQYAGIKNSVCFEKVVRSFSNNRELKSNHLESLNPEIRTLSEKKLIGKRMTMSFSDNKTSELWRSFMPLRKEIENSIGTDYYSIQIYAPLFFDNFNPGAQFEKWATIEVTGFEAVPDEMETYTLKSGLYAVFLYKGAASDAADTFQYILGTWLPNSEFALDDRAHFEILGAKYKNDDPGSEEEIWIPIKPKE